MSKADAGCGKVYLVGAGPGDPGLMTVRGAECLAAADLVLYDGLVNPILLRMTGGRCERTARIRRAAGAPVVAQPDINRRLIDEARQGHVVVRLKGGDPYIFGRGSEEAAALQEAGIPYEVIPGITAATAAGEYAGFSYTHRDIASAVAFITGHEDPTRDASRLDYAAIAAFPGTLVFYMGLSRLPAICDRLISAGMSGDTPAAVICHASLPQQTVVSSTLKLLPEAAAAAQLTPPSLIVVGECVRQRTMLNWFERLPLFGRTVGIVRPAHQIAEVEEMVIALGGQPVALPLLRLQELNGDQITQIEGKLQRLQEFDWVIFSSTNAVRAFHDQLWNAGFDLRKLGHCKIAAVGAATRTALEAIGLRVDIVPERFSAEHLMDALAPEIGGSSVLWVRGVHARPTISDRLRELDVTFEELVVYNVDSASSVDPAEWVGIDARRLTELDWVTVGSPRAAEAFAAFCRSSGVVAEQAPRIAAISELTAQALQDSGFPASAVAAEASWTALLDSIALG